jgi:hypothetical protein
MGEMTDEQRAAFEAALARTRQQEATAAAVPTQRGRTAAQGLTLGFADEIEARARALTTGRPYEELLNEIRGSVKAYQEARPKEAMAYEIGGAAIPAIGGLLAAPFTGGTSAAAVAPTLGRMAAIGGLEGAAYGFGTGEGGAAERLARVPGSAAAGAVGGAVGGAAVRGAGGAITALTDSARRLVGQRGSSVVENEIQRLAQQTGKTPDEIADDIINGRIMAENGTIRLAVRALKTSGGEASRILEEGIRGRPSQTRAEALTDLRQYLSDVGEPSALQAQRRSEDVVRQTERQAYSQFENVPAPAEVVEALEDTLRRVPSASKEVEIMLRAQTGEAPFYKILEDGSVEFTRTPTLMEAERARRAVGNRATALYRESMGGAGEAVSGVEGALRQSVDVAAPNLAATRAQVAATRQQNDIFKFGQNALSGDANERLMEFSRLTSPEEIGAYRAGLMAALEARATTGSRQSLIRNLADPETKEGIILRQVFPEDQLDDVLYRLETAEEAQATAGRVLQGSDTAATLAENARRGMGLSVGDITGVLSGSPDAIISAAQKVVGRFGRDLNDAERARVARILVSQDPELVRRAITDEGGMAALQRRVEQLAVAATQGARRGATVGAAEPGAEISGGALRGLLAQ